MYADEKPGMPVPEINKLTDAGKEATETFFITALAKIDKSKTIVIYSGKSSRVKNTADIIDTKAKELGFTTECKEADWLREINVGEWANQSMRKLETNPTFKAIFKGSTATKFPKGESFSDYVKTLVPVILASFSKRKDATHLFVGSRSTYSLIQFCTQTHSIDAFNWTRVAQLVKHNTLFQISSFK